MGLEVSRDIIFWERSYWFSTPGWFFVGFFFLLELKNSLTAHSRIATTITNHSPQVNQELPCWKNYKKEEEGKEGKDEDEGGDFCHSEGRRDQWEDQGGREKKDYKGYGWLFSTHHFRPCSFSLLLVSACIIPTYGELLLRSPQKLPYTYWQFYSTCPSLHTLVGAWW